MPTDHRPHVTGDERRRFVQSFGVSRRLLHVANVERHQARCEHVEHTLSVGLEVRIVSREPDRVSRDEFRHGCRVRNRNRLRLRARLRPGIHEASGLRIARTSNRLPDIRHERAGCRISKTVLHPGGTCRVFSCSPTLGVERIVRALRAHRSRAGHEPLVAGHERVSAKGVLEGEKADEAILWLAHPAITTRCVEDTAILLNALTEADATKRIDDFHREALTPKRMRVGIARNFKADPDVTAAVNAAVEVVRTMGHELLDASAPFDMPPFGDLRSIEADRKTISDRAFRNIDVLLLPRTATMVPTVEAARSDAQKLSPENTMFANYFGLPAISVPCGVDRNGVPVGLQVVAKPWDDGEVLRLAHQYQAATRASA
jgi:Amidase